MFTAGFNLFGDELAIDTLRQCATHEAHQHLPNGGDQLRSAFRDIALSLSDLHLSR